MLCSKDRSSQTSALISCLMRLQNTITSSLNLQWPWLNVTYVRRVTKDMDMTWYTLACRHVPTVCPLPLVYPQEYEYPANSATDTLGIRRTLIITKRKRGVKVRRANANFVRFVVRAGLLSQIRSMKITNGSVLSEMRTNRSAIFALLVL